jgi:hypothetical protein
MPADLLLIGASCDFEEFSLEWLEKLGALGCDFFNGVGSAHANDRIIAGEARKNMTKVTGSSQHFSDDFI